MTIIVSYPLEIKVDLINLIRTYLFCKQFINNPQLSTYKQNLNYKKKPDFHQALSTIDRPHLFT